MYSKSLFNQNTNMVRSVINPVGVSNSQMTFNMETYEALKAVQEFYTWNLANKEYAKIPTDYNKFLRLYYIITGQLKKVSNKSLKLLFQITEEGLQGAMNAYGLNYTNIELTIENASLKKQIDDILSGRNKKHAFHSSGGHFTLKKSFTLAPLFSYYIMLYGMPDPGVGFDQDKLAVLLNILEKNCINPYK
jgi:hypothetical protein